MAATLLKTLMLTMEANAYQCQLSQAELVDEPTTEEVETFCGKETSSIANYKLNLGGFQDWGDVSGICDLIHTAYVTDPIAALDFILVVGSKMRTGTCKPTKDVPFGGDAGSPLKFSVTLDVLTVTDGAYPSKGAAAPGDVFLAEPTVTASDAPNAAKLAGLGFVALPLTAWTTGQKITVGTYDFHWSGTAWAAGAAS